MKRILRTAMLFWGLMSALGWAVTPEDDHVLRDRVATFLQSNVMGRTQQIVTEGTIHSDGKDYRVKFKATVKWDGFRMTQDGFVFEQTREIEQTNTLVNASGQAAGPEVKNDRTVVMQYALTERTTNNSLVGLALMTKNTLEDPTGVGFVAMIELSADGKELYLYESQAGFGESSLDGKNIIPTAAAAEATLYLDEAGKLVINETLKLYKVDVNNEFKREEIDRFNLTGSEVNR